MLELQQPDNYEHFGNLILHAPAETHTANTIYLNAVYISGDVADTIYLNAVFTSGDVAYTIYLNVLHAPPET